MKPGHYVLSRKLFAFLGNYVITDAAGAIAIRFAGRLRIALRFDAIDAAGRALFRGQGLLVDASNRVAFTREGQPCGSMRAVWEGGLRREGPQKGHYVVEGIAGDTFQTRGDCTAAWSLWRHETEVARVERRGRRWAIELLDGTHGEFVLVVVMAIVHQTLGDERSLD